MLKPQLDDNLVPYLYLPCLSTLYGMESNPQRWIRVVDDGSGNSIYTKTYGGETTDVIECVEVSIFMQYVSYGYTPYIEAAFSGLDSDIDLSVFRKIIFTQAMMRSYEYRAKALMEIIGEKTSSILTKNAITTREPLFELSGVLLLWENLMNTGSIHPAGILEDSEIAQRGTVNLKTLAAKYDELCTRMHFSNFVHIPMKMSNDDRIRMFSCFGCGL